VAGGVTGAASLSLREQVGLVFELCVSCFCLGGKKERACQQPRAARRQAKACCICELWSVPAKKRITDIRVANRMSHLTTGPNGAINLQTKARRADTLGLD